MRGSSSTSSYSSCRSDYHTWRDLAHLGARGPACGSVWPFSDLGGQDPSISPSCTLRKHLSHPWCTYHATDRVSPSRSGPDKQTWPKAEFETSIKQGLSVGLTIRQFAQCCRWLLFPWQIEVFSLNTLLVWILPSFWVRFWALSWSRRTGVFVFAEFLYDWTHLRCLYTTGSVRCAVVVAILLRLGF